MAAGSIQLWRDPALGNRGVDLLIASTRRIATQVISMRSMSSRFSDLARSGTVSAAVSRSRPPENLVLIRP